MRDHRPFKTRVYVGFEFDKDKVLKDFIIGQAKLEDSPFVVEDWSLKEEAPSATWKVEAQQRISRVDRVLIMVGPTTYKASGVLAEVDIANALRKPIFQVIGYRDTKPTAVPNAGQLYEWNWDNLKRLLT